jgi:hypothetical protein
MRVGRLCAACALLVLEPNLAVAGTPDCSEAGSPIIYGAGGSAQRDLVGKAAVILQSSDDPAYVVYQDAGGACVGINALTGLGAATITGSAYYWDTATGTRVTCNLDLSGNTVQFAVMGTGPYQCPLVTDQSYLDDITTVTGPISAYSVITSNASTQQAISAEAFYLVYGFGPDADIAPWNNADPSYYIHRDENSAAQIVMTVATGLPITKYYGVDAGSNSNSVAWVAAVAEPEQGIAFCSADVADASRASIHTLAWKAVGQNAAYWPDSSATAYDKVNVRNGQYELWNPVHFYGPQGASEGSFANADVQALLGYLSGQSQPAGTTQTITETAALNKNVPVCAMHVARDGDLGPAFVSHPDEPCDCYFDYTATGSTTCDTCDDANPCSGTAVCRFGFCEAY